MANGHSCVIFQLIDDHSRLALASHVDTAETAAGALAVVTKAITTHVIPQKFLSDNGASFNSSRRGWTTQLMAYLAPMGVVMITGKPGKPTTQGNNERFHKTLFTWLDKRPAPNSIAGMQVLVDEFDLWYNSERRHQGLARRDTDGRRYRLTPQQAWDPDYIVFADMDGTVIVIHEHPLVGTTYVRSGVLRGRLQKADKAPGTTGAVSPES
ncbi:MAG: integrase core domain-containing protein [Corynebacterium glyciniphilum]|nr:integrase core domain-containing protein [Corynebacterium glyciniphilum]MDN6704590.1 integrase core domain-containing protein [Corynebacterium glyciniphilum]